MGEIGINRSEYLYELDYVDILLTLRGYEKRHRHLWSSTRWSTFQLMRAQAGDDAMQKAGIYTPRDLMPFPWEKKRDDEEEQRETVTKEDVERLREMMRKMNESSS